MGTNAANARGGLGAMSQTNLPKAFLGDMGNGEGLMRQKPSDPNTEDRSMHMCCYTVDYPYGQQVQCMKQYKPCGIPGFGPGSSDPLMGGQ